MTALQVDLASPVPVYEQIRSQVSALVAVGGLRPGDRLPASRDLARDLGIAVGTVQRAYRELEASGVVTSRRRVGTVIAEPPATAGSGEVSGDAARPGGVSQGPAGKPASDPSGLVGEARALVARAREQGLSDEAVLALVRGALLPESR
ncbi:GntR family transcriptional regulator [Promicromonospora iranensis]|uniref:DNA-binding transcriptional regulator YhcF (GntR family) n=1 Tax=Promicromonospora iranensis TaxID=1105144 RepID=A0ABU2CTK0_9MICO|nr:GntR family transcriptional regulator [Promicromonospora iranensis]MDR7384668.1 DNA-binding transcriptional regulator YhcF (GntR family) [Promicromonospora iranensis]